MDEPYKIQMSIFKHFFKILYNPPVQLFILGVCSVIRGAYWEQHDITSRGFLECQGDWDASTLSSQVGLHTKNCNTVEQVKEDSIKV